MQIHELQVSGKAKRKRIARGGKRGTTAGRGTKGQKARSGGNVDPLFEGGRSSLVQRMKKLRGFTSPHPKKNVVTLAQLDRAYADGETVSVETLLAKKLIRKKTMTHGVRIVATGTCDKKLTIDKGILMTEAAEKICGARPAPRKAAKKAAKKSTDK